MTNLEKFREVFGFDNIVGKIFTCEGKCSSCKYMEKDETSIYFNDCVAFRWWKEEYKGVDISLPMRLIGTDDE